MVYKWYNKHVEREYVQFEFDAAKSESNKDKHGIDFVEAQQIWLDEDYLEIPARSDTEPRSVVLGKVDDKHYSAFITMRNEVTRLISVRRSRKKEVEIYESRRTRQII
jgi:uncharacterized DUF497 family protein